MAKALILTTIFLTPLILNFSTRELFEFPKMIFIYSTSILSLSILFWTGGRDFFKTVSKSFLAKPLLLLVAANAVSTLFSTDINTSISGYYTRFNGGLTSLLSFSILYFLAVKTLRRETIGQVLLFLTVGSDLIGIYAVLQHLGLDKNFWVQDSQARAFSTLGQPNWLAAYLLMILPVTFSLMLGPAGRVKKLFFFLSSLIVFAGIWFTYSLSGFLGLGALALCTSGFFERKTLKKNSAIIGVFLSLCLLLAILQPGNFFARLKSAYQNLTGRLVVLASESAGGEPTRELDTSLIRTIVWQGAFNLFLSSPKIFLIGTGPETFAYSFLQFRPVFLNRTTEWDFLYNKAHNYYLDLLSGTGLLGSLAYLGIVVSVFRLYRKRQPKKDLLNSALLSGWTTLLVTNFFGWPTVSTSLLFFLYPAMIEKNSDPEPEKNGARPTKAPSGRLKLILKTAAIASIILGLKTSSDVFLADVHFTKAMFLSRQGFFSEADREFTQAVKLNFKEPAYRREYAFNLAQEALTGTNDQAFEFIKKAEDQAGMAFLLNSKNSLTLKSLLRTYYALAKIDPSFEEKVEQYALKITRLAPTEPRAFYDTALILSYLGKNEEALNYVNKALELRPGYEEAKSLLQELIKERQELESKRGEQFFNFSLYFVRS